MGITTCLILLGDSTWNIEEAVMEADFTETRAKASCNWTLPPVSICLFLFFNCSFHNHSQFHNLIAFNDDQWF